MQNISVSDVKQLIAAANMALGWNDQSQATASASDTAAAKQRLESIFDISTRLAVYGTLAPGRSNYHIVAPLGGDWTEGVVEGDLSAHGWGAALGYPAFRPRVGGAIVPVHVLSSSSLPAFWPALDRFEGVEYHRILVPVFDSTMANPQRVLMVANLYAATSERSPSSQR
ncbi:MAG: gamma-glutamylcyclotransferase [Gemmatimonadaceae bacterium]